MLLPSTLLSAVSIEAESRVMTAKNAELRIASIFLALVKKPELSDSVVQVLFEVMQPQHCPRLRKPGFSSS